jgi:hypothetical protein
VYSLCLPLPSFPDPFPTICPLTSLRSSFPPGSLHMYINNLCVQPNIPIMICELPYVAFTAVSGPSRGPIPLAPLYSYKPMMLIRVPIRMLSSFSVHSLFCWQYVLRQQSIEWLAMGTNGPCRRTISTHGHRQCSSSIATKGAAGVTTKQRIVRGAQHAYSLSVAHKEHSGPRAGCSRRWGRACKFKWVFTGCPAQTLP